jgi:hypothetical protein
MGRTVPLHFYKYRSLSGEGHAFCGDIFANSRLFWPSPRSFNDPFDCAPVPEFPQSLVERRQYARDLVGRTATSETKYQKKAIVGRMLHDNLAALEKSAVEIVHGRLAKVGVCSFSEVPDDILMWSHYADSHQGICLRFSPTMYDWKHFLPHEVEYSRHRPILALQDQNMDAWCKAALLTKAEQWDYEREWRTFDIDGHGFRSFRPSMLDGVILGARMRNDDREAVMSWLDRRRAPGIKLYQATFDPKDFVIAVSPLEDVA